MCSRMMESARGTIRTFVTDHVTILHREVSDKMLNAKQG